MTDTLPNTTLLAQPLWLTRPVERTRAGKFLNETRGTFSPDIGMPSSDLEGLYIS